MRKICAVTLSFIFLLTFICSASAGKVIRLNAQTIDTDKSFPSHRMQLKAFDGRALHLVQFNESIQPDWVKEMEKAGLQVVVYIPDNAYLVYGSYEALKGYQQKAAVKSYVQWNGRYLAEDKIQPSARSQAMKQGRKTALFNTGDEYMIQLVADASANSNTLALIDTLKKRPILRQKKVLQYYNITVALPKAAVEEIAEQPDVVSVAGYIPRKLFDERQGQIVAGNLAGTSPSGPGYLSWLHSMGFSQSQFNASGFVVDVCDSGVDDGTTSPNHFGLYVTGTLSAASRMVYNRVEGSPNSGSTTSGCDGHGNINAHIVGGYNNLSGFPHTDAAGYRYGLGVAPFVRMGSSVIFDPDSFTYPDYSDMISRAYRDNARISTDSWGADTYGDYDADAQEYDALVRDAQPSGAAQSAAGNQEMTIVFAAGNAGPSSGSVGSPGTAKNVITVGAAENVHSHSTANGGNDASGNDGCFTADDEADSADDIASFSSRGPCSDGRTKPEIVAPGTHITGGVAQDSPAPSPASTGNDLACFDATGVCALPGGGTAGDPDNFFPTNQEFYSTSSGTSHSTPAVAGGVALLRQYFINQGWNPPSPAMVKAWLVNAARYMSGTSANDDLWSNDQGMGGMNLGMAFDGVSRIQRDQESVDKFTASGQTRTFSGTVIDANNPVRITLAWTDAPGSTSGSAYNNDLNLTVSIGGQTYKGNVFSGAHSASGGTADPRNNLESVFLPTGAVGAVVIQVEAYNITSDGVPNEAPSLDQDFALVAYNISETPAAVIVADSDSLVSESCGLGNGAIDPDETVTLRIGLKNVGTLDTSNVVATLLEQDGVTSASGPESYGALTSGMAAVTADFTFTATGACGGEVTATLSLQDGTNDLGTVSFDYMLGGQTLSSSAVVNTSSILIPAGGTTEGKASVYPSTMAVSGLQGLISKVSVGLFGLSHTYPDDMDFLLVGPGGENCLILSGVGGSDSISGINLVIDDDAGSYLPGSSLSSGTYKPTQTYGNNPSDTLTSPAPSGPYGTALAEFQDTLPNGTWSLYIYDAYAGDTGSLVDGWKLNIETFEPLCCGSNLPPVLGSIGAKSVAVSNLLSFEVTASDLNDGDAITLLASNLPPWAAFTPVTNTAHVTNTFTGTPVNEGVYTTTFYAVDKDGSDQETVIITVNPAGGSGGDCGLIISEVVEGGSFNKAVELYNGTSADIDLSAGSYTLAFYFNGNTSPLTTISLTGSIPSGETYVVADDGANAAILAVADQTDNGSFYNGNDALVLKEGSTVVDSLGQIGNDVDYNKDVTLIRKPDITEGDTVTGDSFTVSDEWFSLAKDVVTNLGEHVMNCSGGGGGGAPSISVEGGINQSVTVSNLLNFDVTATESDGDTLTLTDVALPAGSTFNAVTGLSPQVAAFNWTPAQTGFYQAVFSATDVDGAATQVVFITVTEDTPAGSNLWINEIHYDNAGSDSGEGVEVAGPAGTALSRYSIVAYNGSTTYAYSTNAFSGTIPDEGCGYGAAWAAILGLQNGAPDGIALVLDGSTVIQFLSYEGTFTAGNGPAAGMTSVDIGVSEGSATAPGNTLQLHGSGDAYTDFTWQEATNAASAGSLNSGQSIAPCGSGSPDSDGDGIDDDWELVYYPDLTNANESTDSDGDGFIDLHEFLAGTIPTNASSLLRLTDVTIATPAASNVVIAWTSESNKSYRIFYSSNLIDGFAGWMSNILATPPQNMVTNDNAGSRGSGYYRVELE